MCVIKLIDIFILLSVIESVICWTYFGCFTYNFDIEQSISAAGLQNTPLTSCSYQCGRLNKRYFILRTTDVSASQDQPVYVYECYCSNDLPTSSSARCRFQCEGGTCGDFNAGSVYSSCNRGRWGWDNQYAPRQCNKECHCADGDICSVHNGYCPGVCADTYWGNSCDKSCDCDSSGGPTCNKGDGTCNCILGRYGARCNLVCGHCVGDAACRQSDGQCTGQCEGGYWGESCTHSCVCNNIGATTCNKMDGKCNCIPGRYGAQCDLECHCAGGSPCGQSDGLCPGDCADTYWGDSCDKSCDCDSSSSPTCNKVDGKCNCIRVRYGARCDQVCGHCAGGAACRQNDGQCPGQCEGGYWGESCTNSCACNSIGAPTCNKVDGRCNCITGRYSDLCDRQCHCAGGAACRQTDGHCPGECEGGYWGDRCSTPCDCESLVACQKQDGQCLYEGCPSGRYGPQCDVSTPYESVGCFFREAVQSATSSEQLILGQDNHLESCRNMCISNKNGYFAVLSASFQSTCHCIRELSQSESNSCTGTQLAVALSISDIFVEVYTTCPLGTYDSRGDGSCNMYCGCTGGDNWSGICTFDGTAVDCRTCSSGWQGELCLVDVDECMIGDHTCGPMGQCQNLAGSYQCQCPGGYYPATDSKSCLDVDECTDGIHNCQHICTNRDGSYSCSCQDGYILEEDGQCTDIDECELVTCPVICTNTEGSYICGCLDGYTLSTNDSQCLDKDECLNGDSDCEHICTNTEGSYSCSCEEGYSLNDDKQSCTEQSPNTTSEFHDGEGYSKGILSAIIVVVILVLIVAVVTPTVIIILRRRQQKQERNPQTDNHDPDMYATVDEDIKTDETEANGNVYTHMPEEISRQSDLVILDNANYLTKEKHGSLDELAIYDNTMYGAVEEDYTDVTTEKIADDFTMNNQHPTGELPIYDSYTDPTLVGHKEGNAEVKMNTKVINGDIYSLANKL